MIGIYPGGKIPLIAVIDKSRLCGSVHKPQSKKQTNYSPMVHN